MSFLTIFQLTMDFFPKIGISCHGHSQENVRAPGDDYVADLFEFVVQ